MDKIIYNGDVVTNILNQLGGQRFIAMTGAKNFVGNHETYGLTFKFMKSKKNTNHVNITLEPNDTYTMNFIAIRGADVKVVSRHEGVYADMLQEIFTNETGLQTHL